MSMIAVIEPPVIAVMEPVESAQKAISDGLSNYGFSPPFGVIFSGIFTAFSQVVFDPFGTGLVER